MTDMTSLAVELREPGSSNQAKRLRATGLIPAVLYGGDRDPRTIAVNPRFIVEILRSDQGQNAILTLRVGDGAEQTALIHDYQVDPITHRLLHADFKRISLDVAVEVNVPIEVVGEAHGVKIDHGILDQILREVHVKCLPTDIPDRFTVDVTEVDIGDVLHMSDLEIPDAVEVLADLDQPIVTVAPPAVAEVVAEEEEEEGLIGEIEEPEVIGKGGGEEDAEEES